MYEQNTQDPAATDMATTGTDQQTVQNGLQQAAETEAPRLSLAEQAPGTNPPPPLAGEAPAPPPETTAMTVAGANPPPAAKTEKKENPGLYVHKFKEPLEVMTAQGKQRYETVNFYFDRLRGDDMILIEQEMQDANEYAITPEMSRGFQLRMAARASGIGADVLRSLPINDFNKITNAARRFLLSTAS